MPAGRARPGGRFDPAPLQVIALAAAALLAPCGGPAAAAAAADTESADTAALCGNGPLEILLTNDDGVAAPGLRALGASLAAAGHRVTIVAPEANASGSSMSFSWGEVSVRQESSVPPVYAVGATPAATVVLAATSLYPDGRRPDLVVSGINPGSNTGPWLVVSGTLGAALAGTVLLDPPVPGIAVSAARPARDEPPDSPANRTHWQAVAQHAAKLVTATRSWFCRDGRVAQRRTVLNVNYPGRPVDSVRGTVVAQQGTVSDERIRFTPSGDGRYRASIAPGNAVDAPESEDHWLGLGYVTVTPVNADLRDGSAATDALTRRLREL